MKPINPTNVYPASLVEVLRDLEPVLTRLGVDFYVVGAVARDIWLTHEGGSPPRRMTRDVDLAILIPDETAYEQLIAELEATRQFQKVRSSVFALIHEPTNTTVDLMPFGGIADLHGTVRVSGAGMEEISTIGFPEMAISAVEISLQGEAGAWRIASIPALLLLKFLAWEDRPEKRGKDATDIALILRYYFELAGDRLYDEHFDLLEDPETDDLLYRYSIAAHVAGRELRALLENSTVLNRISALLRSQDDAGRAATFVRAMQQDGNQDAVSAHRMFARLVQGFEEQRLT